MDNNTPTLSLPLPSTPPGIPQALPQATPSQALPQPAHTSNQSIDLTACHSCEPRDCQGHVTADRLLPLIMERAPFVDR